jgi:hypothetical protein
LKVLFIPNAGAVIPHLAPLMALNLRLDPQVHQSTFLVPARFHAPLIRLGKQVLDIDYRPETAFKDEMSACTQLRPDVIIDDFSMVTLLTATLMDLPRVTIARTGAFPGFVPRDKSHCHSCESIGRFDFASSFRESELYFGIPAPESFADLCAAHASIVPGIQSIETLPPGASSRPDFFFSGALDLPDHLMPIPEGQHLPRDGAEAKRFIDLQSGRNIAFVTVGSVLAPSPSLRQAILHMLDAGVAVISTVNMGDLSSGQDQLFHYAPFVPMHEICSRVDMMVHHCGSGTYQYAILHGLPSICIGSRFYDRDDVGFRLHELGVARFIPASNNATVFMAAFCEGFDLCTDRSSTWYLQAIRQLDALKRENDSNSECFHLESVLDGVVHAYA